jgi:hypothetical protein
MDDFADGEATRIYLPCARRFFAEIFKNATGSGRPLVRGG